MVYASSSSLSNFNPPLGTTTQNPCPANPPPQRRNKSPDIDFLACLGVCGIMLAAFVIFVALVTLFITYVVDATSVGGLPVVSIAYISVSLRNDSINSSNMIMSDWDIGFTVENKKPWSTLQYGDFNISIQSDTGIKSTVGTVPGFRQDTLDMAKLNTTVRAMLPPYNVTDYEVRFGVTFLSEVLEVTMTNEEYKSARKLGIKNNAKLFNGTCANMTITMQGTHGIVGGIERCLVPREGTNSRGNIF